MLDPKLKKKWISALRGNLRNENGTRIKFKQGTARLCSIKKVDGKDQRLHCCLGVLKEIVTKKPLTKNTGKRGYFGSFYKYLPRSIQEEYARYNDEGNSFDEIAYRIEKDGDI